MPTLRSQRSKPSNRKEEEEMPPPADTPPKRTTRGKKAVKQEKASSEVPQSPTASVSSTKSTRSTRTKARAKAEPVEVEEIAMASPPSTRSTRSTKQKTVAKKNTEKPEANKRIPSAAGATNLNPTVQLSPLVIAAKERRPAETASKKGRGRPKKNQVAVESTSDDLTEESDMEAGDKVISTAQLRKQHLVPFKTAVDSGISQISRLKAKLMDDSNSKSQEEKFQQLMSRTEMPPPVASAPKTRSKKGRQKRARSPDKIQAKSTEVPDSFDFTASEVPANKKIRSQPIREINVGEQNKIDEAEEMEVVPSTSIPVADSKEDDSSQAKDDDGKDENKKIKKNEADDVGKNVKKNEKKRKKVKKNDDVKKMQQEDEALQISQKVKEDEEVEKMHKVKEEEEETKSQKTKEDEKNIQQVEKGKEDKDITRDEEEKAKKVKVIKESGEAKDVPKNINGEVEDRIIANVKDQDERKKEEDVESMFEQSTVDLADDSDVMIVERASDIGKEQAGEVKNEDVSDKPTHATKPMDETFVFDTPKDKELKINTTFTPELFTDTPKSRVGDQTIIVSSKHAEDNKDKVDPMLAPTSPELDSECNAFETATGKVSSLVNFFDKNKKDNEVKKGVASNSKAQPDRELMNITRSISPDHADTGGKATSVPANDLNSTYVLPTVTKTNSSSVMNVTMCVKKAPDTESTMSKQEALKPIVPPHSFLQQTNSSRFMHDSPASRTFVKEPPGLAAVPEEEEEKKKESIKSAKDSEKIRPLVNVKPAQKEKPKDKGASSSSSSSSSSSMKSASSQPCLVPKKLPQSAAKNGPNYGSAGKLHEVVKSNPLVEAEKRRQELMQQKVEQSKKKNAEWSKKTEKNRLEEEKRKKELLKAVQPPPPPTSSVLSSSLKKPAPMAFGKTAPESAAVGYGFTKPKLNFGPSTKMHGSANFLPPLSKTAFHKQALPPPPADADMDDSFKSANASLLDQTVEGHLSSYDITVYEDLDEDLKHRENKTLPNWASDKDALKVALFSMVLLPDYQNRLSGGFPKPDKSYKLFPGKMGHH